MLKQHTYYVYYEGNLVYARMENREPVLAETLKTPQEAHDKVQSIVNPGGRSAASFGPKGFLEAEFQGAISKNCEAYVVAAYAAAAEKVTD